MTWRDTAKRTLFFALQELGDRRKDMSIDEIRIFLNGKYPFGERAHFPYKVWLEELRLSVQRIEAGRGEIPYTDGQMNLFNQNTDPV